MQATVAESYAAAENLAAALGLALLDPGDTADKNCFAALLLVSPDTLALQAPGRSAPNPVAVDFGAAAMRHRRRGGQNELLGRAVGVGKKSPLRVLDATAGLGRDSFVLADLGCEVTLAEREPVVAALLRSGLAHAGSSADRWLGEVVGRMTLAEGDARQLGAAAVERQDVIYLDPMFPPRDKSAAVKKEMALFQALFSHSDAVEDASALLAWALQMPVARVVVKRPLKAAPLGGRAASHAIRGKAVRYDVYVLSALGAG
ncbi:class I SAM-dependent methyltransferase [Haliea sp. E1-2-M8]|uniref:class I SAM-dependent methyltransferase n=1 Tax=Haliea sp. E1-2-M8 TaxID=3064706 RepID=UPI00272632EE|nr:class I SAM-dependent methyltransferase [Haliea sp. E1-2-M8]MDO8861470.1 class I SAM-dependent methyltransferase [Haliea sp. E1-2-M8]